jgi:hypothetical protein
MLRETTTSGIGGGGVVGAHVEWEGHGESKEESV